MTVETLEAEVPPKHVLDIQGMREVYGDEAKETAEVQTAFSTWFTTAEKAQFDTHYVGDTSLTTYIATDKDCPTAQIDVFGTGHAQIGQSLAMACLEQTHGCDHRLLRFLIAHEYGHFWDLRSLVDKGPAFEDECEDLAQYLEDCKASCDEIWRQFQEDRLKTDEDKKLFTNAFGDQNPLWMLYHRYFNLLDDTIVNKKAISHFATLRRLPLAEIYETTLFPKLDQGHQQTRCMALGEYLLNRMMSLDRDINLAGFPSEVREAIQATRTFNGSEQTLKEILHHAVRNHNAYYGARRYPGMYQNHFVPVFEDLLKKDLEEINLPELLKLLQSMAKEGKGDMGDNLNPDKIRETKESARKKADQDHQDRQDKNEKDGRSDRDRQADAISADAKDFANEHGTDPEKTRRFHQLEVDNQEHIERTAREMIGALLADTQWIHEIETRRHQETGEPNVDDIIDQLPQHIGKDGHAFDQVYDEEHHLERTQRKIIAARFRIAIDNSGSTISSKEELEEVLVVMEKASTRAIEILEGEEYNYAFTADIQTEVILYGNQAESIKPLGRPDTKKNDAQLIRAFSRITCHDGTDDSTALDYVDQTFDPEEVKSTEEEKRISALIIVSDGYTHYPDRSAEALARVEAKGVTCAMARITTEQPYDVPLEAYTDREAKAVQALDPTRSSQHEAREANAALDAKIDEWHQINKNMIDTENPSIPIWGDKITPPLNAKGIVPRTLVKTIYRAVAQGNPS